MKGFQEHIQGLKWFFECRWNSPSSQTIQQSLRTLRHRQSILASTTQGPKSSLLNRLDTHQANSSIFDRDPYTAKPSGTEITMFNPSQNYATLSDTNMFNILGNNLALVLFIAFFFFRYCRLFVSIYAYLTYKPYPIFEKARYRAADVTVVIPTTFKSPEELAKCLRRILDCSPAAIFVVTADANVQLVRDLFKLNAFDGALNNFRQARKTKLEVLGIGKLNKRNQMIKALRKVSTDVVVFADDDVFWPDRYLDHLLAIFENPRVGAGGTRQRVRRNQSPNVWNFLGVSYLERRVWNNIATNAIDGSISTLSGRSAAYLTTILKNEEFFHYFTHDEWLGHKLNTDDDKCLTRYVYSHGWEIAIQTSVYLETTLEDNSKYIQQCLRWARAHWRGNFTVLTNESYWRSWKYSWGTYYIYFGQFQTPALLVDGVMLGLLLNTVATCSHQVQILALTIFGSWVVFTKLVKLIPHYVRYPQDLIFLPVSLLFSYIHGIINIYALFTLHVTGWGSQNLHELEQTKAQNDEVAPLLRKTMEEIGGLEPTPGRLMDGDDYFSAAPYESQYSHPPRAFVMGSLIGPDSVPHPVSPSVHVRA